MKVQSQAPSLGQHGCRSVRGIRPLAPELLHRDALLTSMELNANVTPSEKSLEQINPKPRKKNYKHSKGILPQPSHLVPSPYHVGVK